MVAHAFPVKTDWHFLMITVGRAWSGDRQFDPEISKWILFLQISALGETNKEDEMQKRVSEEYREFGDIVQGDFVDSYYNNTIKTMMGLRWAVEACPKARFYTFVDDDYYVSTRNLLRFLRNPVNYPRYLEDPVISFDDIPSDHRERGPDGRPLRRLQQVGTSSDSINLCPN